METISIWSILTASITSFIIGAVWYSPILFGKEWMSLIGATERDIAEAKEKGMTKSYVIQFIISVITFTVIAFAISGLDAYTAQDGAFVGFISWIGFVVPSATGNMLWEKKSSKYALITSVATLISWIVGGAIIGGWN